MPFVIQNSYILLAPALFAATTYMILGRIIQLTDGDQHSIVSSRKLTWFFLLGDIFLLRIARRRYVDVVQTSETLN